MKMAHDRHEVYAMPLPQSEMNALGLEPGPCTMCAEPCPYWVVDEHDELWRIHYHCWGRSTRRMRLAGAGHRPDSARLEDSPITAGHTPERPTPLSLIHI